MLLIQNISPYLTTDNVTLLLAASFSLFCMYKSVQILVGSVTPGSSGIIDSVINSSTSSPIVRPPVLSSPSISSISESSTIMQEKILPVPDPTPLMVQEPIDQLTSFIESIGEVFTMLMGF